jgi:hypothetical protein
MTVQVLWHGETRGRGSEWGLDLAFVRLHRPDDVERIKGAQVRGQFIATSH